MLFRTGTIPVRPAPPRGSVILPTTKISNNSRRATGFDPAQMHLLNKKSNDADDADSDVLGGESSSSVRRERSCRRPNQHAAPPGRGSAAPSAVFSGQNRLRPRLPNEDSDDDFDGGRQAGRSNLLAAGASAACPRAAPAAASASRRGLLEGGKPTTEWLQQKKRQSAVEVSARYIANERAASPFSKGRSRTVGGGAGTPGPHSRPPSPGVGLHPHSRPSSPGIGLHPHSRPPSPGLRLAPFQSASADSISSSNSGALATGQQGAGERGETFSRFQAARVAASPGQGQHGGGFISGASTPAATARQGRGTAFSADRRGAGGPSSLFGAAGAGADLFDGQRAISRSVSGVSSVGAVAAGASGNTSAARSSSTPAAQVALGNRGLLGVGTGCPPPPGLGATGSHLSAGKYSKVGGKWAKVQS